MSYREIKSAYTKDDEQIYVYTNSDGVYVGEEESKTLTNKLSEIDIEINKGSQKIEEVNAQLLQKTNDTDSNRTTKDKSVTGSINELNSGLGSVNTQLYQSVQQISNLDKKMNTKIIKMDKEIKYDNFENGLFNWNTTKGIKSNSGLENTSNATRIYTNVALYNALENQRALEFMIDGTVGKPSEARICFGVDESNFGFITLKNLNYYQVKNGFIVSTPTVFTSSLAITPNAIDRYKFVMQGQNVQLFVNDILIETLIVSDNSVFPVFNDKLTKLGFEWNEYSTANYQRYKYARIFPKISQKYMHLSIDDFHLTLKECKENGYTSVFQHELFAKMKELHDTYGAVFSCYCFYENSDTTWNLGAVGSTYTNELSKCADWLKFGFHARNNNSNLATDLNTSIQNDYNLVMSAISTFASSNAIDVCPRLHNYAGNIDTIRLLKENAKYPIKGLLSAEDTRTSYYHTVKQKESLWNCDDLYDAIEDIYFIKTDCRLENTSNGYLFFENREGVKEYNGQQDIHIIFTHESKLLDTLLKEGLYTKLEQCCKYALDKGYVFDYPMYNIPKC